MLKVETEALTEKIRTRSARSAVIGLGYVGLPLAVEMAQAGFTTMGLDLSAEKVQSINRGKNYIKDIQDEVVTALVGSQKLKASVDFEVLRECDCISICVPTPLGKGKNPDMSFILSAVQEVKKYLHKGQIIILESTTYPGTTEELVLPLLEETGLTVGKDFFLAFSPERIDPGNPVYGLKNTPKIVGGVTPACTEMARHFYQAFIETVIPVSTARSAEMVKLLENTFRAINIGLANEVAIMCHHLGIDTWEIVDAAASKPFGFMPFYPGPGLGGHCIPVDPHYLLWKMKSMNYDAKFIQLADEINSSMPRLVVQKIADGLNEQRKAMKGSRLLVLGVAYKKDIDDCRESPALDVIELLMKRGAEVDYHDPFVPSIRLGTHTLHSIKLSDVSKYDCVALLTNHSCFKIEPLVEQCALFMDTRNATKGIPNLSGKIIKI